MDIRYYYEFLGLDSDATEDDVIQAYKRKAKMYHPDFNNSRNAQEIMKELNLARDEVLKNIRGHKVEYQQDNNFYYEWKHGTNESFNLWLNRGRCSENVWMWCMIPFLMPYAYYKVGMGWRGIGFLIGVPILWIILAMIGIVIGLGGGFVVSVYCFYETYNIAKEYNNVYKELT